MQASWFDSVIQAEHNDSQNCEGRGKFMGNPNSTLQALLQDLKTALSEALTESASLSTSVKRIRAEGWSLHLVVDRKSRHPPFASVEISPREVRRHAPSFRIDGRDLSFLQSIGIDPTRRLRNRRHRQ